ncbi:hypothetical protein ACFV0T_08970 [Streptomyces sp. NPDC059582]|uniref:hypothetical protein n=1 Tax=Streptomyces sp. NPDC059582 TaxID=3346875 RepID=UPI0036A9E850
MHARGRRLFVGFATAALLVGGTTAATAEGTPAPTPTGDGARALCKRLPKIDDRIDRVLTRLNAGVDTRGSIARLQKRVDNAKAAGHDEIETYLQDRLTFRKSLVSTLRQRQKDLAGVKTWCQADGNGNDAGRS